MKELDEKGYCVIPNVLTSEECDARVAAYRDWLAKFPEGDWPLNEESLIMTYRIGHFDPTWQVRLAAKKVFEVINIRPAVHVSTEEPHFEGRQMWLPTLKPVEF